MREKWSKRMSKLPHPGGLTHSTWAHLPRLVVLMPGVDRLYTGSHDATAAGGIQHSVRVDPSEASMRPTGCAAPCARSRLAMVLPAFQQTAKNCATGCASGLVSPGTVRLAQPHFKRGWTSGA